MVGYVAIYSDDGQPVLEYPVMQGEDNDYWLHHLPNGTELKSGSIELSCYQDWESSGLKTLLGHRMANGTMFKPIVYYSDPDYMETHSNIVIYTDDREIHLEPAYFGLLDADGRWVKRLEGEELDAFIFDATGNKIEGERLYAFATCSVPGDAGHRCILICVETDEAQ